MSRPRDPDHNSEARAHALAALDILDTAQEPEFDDIAGLASQICEAPVALVSLIDGERQWFKARVGMEACQTSLDQSVCAHAIGDPVPGIFQIADLTVDPRTHDNPLVTGAPHLRFYAGAPLVTPEGQAIGTLCVLDQEPRPDGLTPAQATALTALAQQVMSLLVLRRTSTALVAAERREAEQAHRESHEAQEARRVSEARYRTLFDAIDQGFCIIEFFDGPHGPLSDYVHVEANPGYERQTGIANIVGQTIRVMTPAEADGWVEIYGAVLRTGEPVRFEREFVLAGRYIEVSAHRIEPANLRQVAILFSDISDRKRAERGLRAHTSDLEQRVATQAADVRLFGDIIQASAAPICAFDHEFRLIAFNQAHSDEFFRIMGHRVQLGEVFPDLFPAEQREVIRGFMARALTGEVYTVTEDFGDPALVKPYWEISYSPLCDQAGEIIGAFHYARDITSRLRAEAELATTQDALRQSQKMEAIGQLTGGVAHDFNNLLTVIKSSTDLLKRPDLPVERRGRYVEAIANTVDRAAKLTGQLLAFARRQTLKPETFDASESVRALTEMMHTLTGSRIEIVTDLPDTGCNVHADPSQFDTALVNLAVNARDAMDGAGRITLAVRSVPELPARRSHGARAGGHVAVSLSDTGSGIAPDQLERIFEPFFTTKGVGKGTGLGLSQVIGFAKQSGGDVMVESALGQGTTFTLYLPCATAEVVRDKKVEDTSEQPAEGHGTRVLVVEDNADVGAITGQSLEDLGYEIQLATDAERALVVLAAAPERFDVVFSDVVMPGMGGIALGQELRRLYHDLPVVLTSGYSHVLAEEGPKGVELLQKPYSAEELSRMLYRAATWRRRQRLVSR